MVKFTKTLVLLFTTIGLSSNAFAADLTIGIDAGYPPFSKVEGDGTVVGIEADYAAELCLRLEKTCEMAPMQFDALITALQSRKIDLIIGSMSITDQRKKVIDFSAPYYRTGMQMIGDSNQGDFNTEGKIIGVERGSIQANYADDKFKNNEVKIYDSMLSAVTDLANGRINLVLADQLAGYSWVEENGGDKFSLVGPIIKEAFYSGPGVGVGIRKGNDELLNAINTATAEMHGDGTFDTFTTEFFPFSIK